MGQQEMGAARRGGPARDGEGELGKFLRQRQLAMGMTVAALCQRAGITREAWYRMVRGDTSAPTLQVLRRLAAAYRVPVSELVVRAYPDSQPRLAGAVAGAGQHPLAAAHAPAAHSPAPILAAVSLPTVQAGAAFLARWAIGNPGDATWHGLDLRCVDEPSSPAADLLQPLRSSIELPEIAPGQRHSIALQFRAPERPGCRSTHWRLFRGERALDWYDHPGFCLTVRVV